jgi:hypothetical protein
MSSTIREGTAAVRAADGTATPAPTAQRFRVSSDWAQPGR